MLLQKVWAVNYWLSNQSSYCNIVSSSALFCFQLRFYKSY